MTGEYATQGLLVTLLSGVSLEQVRRELCIAHRRKVEDALGDMLAEYGR